MSDINTEKELIERETRTREILCQPGDKIILISVRDEDNWFKITPDERKYLQACVLDSDSEGNFDPLFSEIDAAECLGALIKKGLIDGVFEEGNPYPK